MIRMGEIILTTATLIQGYTTPGQMTDMGLCGERYIVFGRKRQRAFPQFSYSNERRGYNG